ncbi:hypothetical protein FPOAC1_008908 [Fusarium poae]|uniref:hypothetical protein n=1 Tax=Fusarium poae TaxID=36050 RepID=UPI001CE717B6|nr:hypothetical protein FPOAC1_008908 [Fusarium poae]KAG8669513.1 hypothetical protein FPOAC1_008908 [Fusarium poae]
MADFKPKSILIFGATGTIGRYISNAIANAEPAFDQVTIFTSEDTVTRKYDLIKELKAKAVKVVTGDVNNEEDVKKAYQGIDTVVSAVGRNVIETQINLFKLATQSDSVKWFFPSEYGTDVEYGPQSVDEKPHQLKLKVRKFIRENSNSLKYTFMVTGPYIDMFFTLTPTIPEAGGFDHVDKKAVLVDNGQGKIGFTTMPDVGKSVVAALRHPSKSFNEALKVQSFVVTQQQILKELEKQTGGEPWAITNYTLDELREAEKNTWAEGNPSATLYTLRRIWSEGGTLYKKTDNERIGLKDEDLETLEDAVHRRLTTGY